jgi:DNA-binding transcriptional ArsR family regulator
VKVEDGKQIEQNKQRAEVFDALGHPTRILILKVLSEGAIGFADLKKKTAIESSGHLQHHLTKLNGLIKTDDYGHYCLSDEGKDALLTVQTVENSSPRTNTKEKEHRYFKVGLKPVAFLLVALLIASSAIAVYEYNQTLSQNKSSTNIPDSVVVPYPYFGEIQSENIDQSFPSQTDINSTFQLSTDANSIYSPPINIYRALQIGLEAEGWNKTSIQGMKVSAYLAQYQWSINSKFLYNTNVTVVTNPPLTYSYVLSNGVIRGYAWEISVEPSIGFTTPPLGYSLVDASTGQLIPPPALY